MTNYKRDDYKHLSRADIEAGLSEMEKKVTLHNGTEPPFGNAFYNNREEGIYIDLYTGEPLFTSLDQFDSGCGWPSFTKPVEPAMIQENVDQTHGMVRTEVRASVSDVHLGHVFTDGPQDQGGLRYCINSAALRFIPRDELEVTGYAEYLALFQQKD